jgi:hypothetical protein
VSRRKSGSLASVYSQLSTLFSPFVARDTREGAESFDGETSSAKFQERDAFLHRSPRYSEEVSAIRKGESSVSLSNVRGNQQRRTVEAESADVGASLGTEIATGRDRTNARRLDLRLGEA